MRILFLFCFFLVFCFVLFFFGFLKQIEARQRRSLGGSLRGVDGGKMVLLGVVLSPTQCCCLRG